MTDVSKSLIAPCGMNCGICMAYLRTRNVCKGCRAEPEQQTNHCAKCAMRNCELLAQTASKFCYECTKYPCARVKHIDKRYRTRYKMSMIENLANIKQLGLARFESMEKERWKCNKCGGSISVHHGYCLKCK